MKPRAWGVVGIGAALAAGLLTLPPQTASGVESGSSSAALTADASQQRVPKGLKKCRDAWPTYCGKIEVPLDRTGTVTGTQPIHFEYYPPKSKTVNGTIVAMEGGPGYATTKSRDYYLDLFEPMMRDRALLLVDQRGTGLSRPLNCPEAQSYKGDWVADAAKCGERLGNRSDLFTTANAADDLNDVLRFLKVPVVDVYGDSYGSFSAQTFAVRYPQRVRSLILDATYPIEGLDPWYRTTATALRQNLARFCSRSPQTCPVEPYEMVGLTREVLRSVRTDPLTTKAPNGRGRIVTVTLTPRRILDTLLYTDVTPGYVRATPAALVSFTEGNELPLARMVAEATGSSTSASAMMPARRSLPELRAFSEGAYLAYACTDYPQLWNVKSDRQGRNAQYQRAVNKLDSYSVAPWTSQEWSQSEFFVFDYCIGWPKPRVAEAPFPEGGSYPETPTLVLNGDLDLRTDIYQAQQVAENFPNSAYLEVPNYGHVTALYDPDKCTSVIVRRFVRTLETGDTSCLASISEHRVVNKFAQRAAGAPEATVRRASDESRAADRRAAYVAVESVADVIDRWYAIPGYRGTSLYGGRFVMWTTYSDPFVSRIWKMRLDKIRWTKDIAVSGKGQMQRGAGEARMELQIGGSGTDKGELVVTWSTRDAGAMATIRGVIGGRTVNLKAPAPSYF